MTYRYFWKVVVMMPFPILHTGTDIRVLCLSYSVRGIEIHCGSPCTGDACPRCGRVSRRIHSRYERLVWDGARQAVAVALVLKVRNFFCDNPRCPRTVFSDSFPETAPPYCRRTQRLTSQPLDPLCANMRETHGVTFTEGTI
ncbi:transposase family protein [Sulfidibacter corallicola]